MKELLQQFSEYHVWANGLMLQTILQLPEATHTKEVNSSFPSLYKTVVHQWDAESIWWQRMKLEEQVQVPGLTFRGDLAAAGENWQKQSRQWSEWIAATQEYQLQHEFIYRNSKKEQFKQPVYQVLLHLFNHGTYHRGQLVTILRQLGVDALPSTDFIGWTRKK
ncbi:MAG TPA: DinB family protein [Flavisolibacter sp.]|jgi:uncharacterized damage-inducible protein DinB